MYVLLFCFLTNYSKDSNNKNIIDVLFFALALNIIFHQIFFIMYLIRMNSILLSNLYIVIMMNFFF